MKYFAESGSVYKLMSKKCERIGVLCYFTPWLNKYGSRLISSTSTRVAARLDSCSQSRLCEFQSEESRRFLVVIGRLALEQSALITQSFL